MGFAVAVVFIGAALSSTTGWLISLACSRSAARRHLLLTTALGACLLLPVAMGVRQRTNLTVLTIRTSGERADSFERDLAARSNERPVEHNPFSRESDIDPARASDSDLVQETLLAAEENESTEQNTAVERSGDSSGKSIVGPTATSVLAAAYLLVAVSMLVRLLASLFALQRIKRQSIATNKLFDGIPILEADVVVPLAVGFGRPAIVLPRGLRSSSTPEELQDVLAHEVQHLKRNDHRVMLLQRVAAAIYWPIVTVHLLNRALVRAREELCDNAVVTMRDPAAYGRTLLAVAERATGLYEFAAYVAPSVIHRGELERRVAALIDSRRDRRTRIGWRARWAVAIGLIAASSLVGTTRLAAVADEPPAVTAEANDLKHVPPTTKISWTGVPKIDLANAALHKGVVLGTDGKPLAGASIYAGSTIELLEMADAEDLDVKDLGPVRAVTDAQGRFQFNAEDLTWVTPAGERKRWETLLVAVKEGLPPAWLKTWGADRTLREHWHPSKDREIAIRTRPPAMLTGRLLLEGGGTLAGAHVRLTGLMAPVDYDLDKHIPREEEKPLGLFATIAYAEAIYRPQVLPGLNIEARTNEDGGFELPGLPEGFIASIQITHREAVTTELRVAVRPIKPVYRKPQFEAEKPTLTLRGSGFTAELPKGTVLRGQVATPSYATPAGKAAGVTVALANHNAKDGMWGQRFKTDEDGRFEMTGLPKSLKGSEVAFAGSFAAPYADRRQRMVPGEDARVEVIPATPYRLKLLDPHGNPVEREVYSMEVQAYPGNVRHGIKYHFNDAEQVAPGTYAGIVPRGPGAVLVKRRAKTDRPAAVNPKQFFEPGRSDWTPQEQRFAYGDLWHIAHSAVVETEALSVGHNPTTEQIELAAIVLSDATPDDSILELTATVYSDPPVQVTLVDEVEQPVVGAKLERQLKRYNGEDLPATFPVYGLHPERAEFLIFTHAQRGLVATLSATWGSEPLRVVMRPAATLVGRITDASGQPNHDFSIRVFSKGLMPDTFVAGRMYNPTQEPGERPGEFRLVLPPGEEVRGEFVRRLADYWTRPSAGAAFGPLMPKPGETIQLGDLVVP